VRNSCRRTFPNDRARRVWPFAIVVAVNQIGVGATLINTPLNGHSRGSGIGTRPGFSARRTGDAAKIVAGWYNRPGSRAKTEKAAENVEEQAQENGDRRQASPAR